MHVLMLAIHQAPHVVRLPPHAVSPAPSPDVTVLMSPAISIVAVTWTDALTAVSTALLALLAGVSAFYAWQLWQTASQQLIDASRSASEQLAEMRRATNSDIQLRVLERCDEFGLRQAELRIGALYGAGPLKTYDGFALWMKGQTAEKRSEVMTNINQVISSYEQIGLVVRRVPSVSDVVVEHLSLRAPQMWNCLKALIDHTREQSPLVSVDFENLAIACSEFAERSGVRGGNNLFDLSSNAGQ